VRAERAAAAAAAGSALSEPAPAKINLYLHVVGRRDDGYHLLDSLLVFAAIHDLVVAAPAEELSLAIEGPFAPALAAAGENNLVLRAARMLAEAAALRRGAHLRLIKHLPVAAGLGGGSADAAAALRLLCRLWRLQMPAADLAEIGLRLGADVPACLASQPVLVSGIGERLEPLTAALPEAYFVLANPGNPVPTAPVFRARPPDFRTARPIGAVPTTLVALIDALGRCANDLQATAVRLHPEIGEVLDALGALPGARLARMSGSGGTCFALFASRSAAAAGAGMLARLRPTWWVAATPMLKHDALGAIAARGLDESG